MRDFILRAMLDWGRCRLVDGEGDDWPVVLGKSIGFVP